MLFVLNKIDGIVKKMRFYPLFWETDYLLIYITNDPAGYLK